MFYNFKKNKKAFTLVELIVVIAIIAILGAVVGVTVSTFVNRARETAAKSPLNGLCDNWEANVNATGKDIKNLYDFIKDLFPNDYNQKSGNDTVFGVNKDNWWGKKPTDLKTETFKIYFHNDDCGDFYGVLEVKSGVWDKKNISTVKAKPSDFKQYAEPKA